MVRILFALALMITFFAARFISYVFHDRRYYGTPFDNSRTFTGILRRRTGIDWHHYHFGFLVALLSLVFYYFFNNAFFIISLAVGVSLLLDQADFFIFLDREYFKSRYFRIGSLLISLLFHLIIIFVILFL